MVARSVAPPNGRRRRRRSHRWGDRGPVPPPVPPCGSWCPSSSGTPGTVGGGAICSFSSPLSICALFFLIFLYFLYSIYFYLLLLFKPLCPERSRHRPHGMLISFKARSGCPDLQTPHEFSGPGPRERGWDGHRSWERGGALCKGKGADPLHKTCPRASVGLFLVLFIMRS